MKKTFLFVMCGVLALTLVTGCGNEKKNSQDNSKNDSNVSETKNTVLSCTKSEEGDIELNIPNSSTTEEYTYDKDMILTSVKIVEEDEYKDQEEVAKRTEQTERYANNFNKEDGISYTYKVNGNKIIITRIYDMNKIDKDKVLGSGMKKYIDSNNKFSAKEYKDNFLESNKDRNATCNEK